MMSKLERTCKILEACEHEPLALSTLAQQIHMWKCKAHLLTHEMADKKLLEIIAETKKRKNRSARHRLTQNPATYTRFTYRITARGLEVLEHWKRLQKHWRNETNHEVQS